ncbi:putative ribosome maturation factor RimO [Enterobacter hormaechei subsp. xiangfangensis]|nr:putative ribosome maturation factor RimO [Enterobacter hormaechei subsp. xiangfangensis]
MQLQQQISAERLQEKVGREILVIIDEVDEEGAIGRSMADAPEIDGADLNGETNASSPFHSTPFYPRARAQPIPQ